MTASAPSIRVSRLKWLSVIGAALLLVGVLISCHGALRTSQWMLEATSTDPLRIKNGEGADEWFALIASIQREESFAAALSAIGAGALAGSLVVLVVMVRWQFTLRTLIFATIYLSILVGIPLGFVRPKLLNPRLSVDPATFVLGLGQIRPYPRSVPESDDPWKNKGSVSRGGSTLLSGTTMLMALVAFLCAPAIAYLPIPKMEP